MPTILPIKLAPPSLKILPSCRNIRVSPRRTDHVLRLASPFRLPVAGWRSARRLQSPVQPLFCAGDAHRVLFQSASDGTIGGAPGLGQSSHRCKGSAMERLLIALTFCLAFPVPGVAQTGSGQTKPGPTIEIAHPFARATALTPKTGAAYFTIVNAGASDDRLIAASSPIAEKSELHATIDDNGVMKMRPLVAIAVKAGERGGLKPGGLHLMLTGLQAPLKDGPSPPLTLTF